jgi:hypothetical protein
MSCIHCGKIIEEGNGLVYQGNSFCNNLCRYSYEKANGKSNALISGIKKDSDMAIKISSGNLKQQKDIPVKKERLAWKIYFWILVILGLSTYVLQGFHRFWEVLDFLYFIGSMIGFGCFCWHKRMLSVSFWEIFLWTSLAWNILYLFVFPILPHYEIFRSGPKGFIYCLANFAFFTPLEIALFLFAYKRKYIWN